MREWTEKYRPEHLDNIIGQDNVIKALKKWAEKEVVEIPNLLFYGPPGTGKTSAARAFCRDGRFVFKEMNAAQKNKKEDIEAFEKSFLNTSLISDFEEQEDEPIRKSKYGAIYILDKGERITADAQNVMEKYLEDGLGGVKVILIVNTLEGKISDPLQTRFNKYEFKPLEYSDMKKLILNISREENLNISSNIVEMIIKDSKGTPRDAIRKLYDYAVMYLDP